MHIVLFHFYSRNPNPVYEEIGRALRRRGHSVWIGAPDHHGNLTWHDGKRVIAVQPGPGGISPGMGARSLVSKCARTLGSLRFIMRVRRFLKREHPDIIQVNPPPHGWLLPLLMPSGMHFVMDIRQINERVSHDLLARAKEVRAILSMRMCARYFYEHTCFCHEGAATKIMGRNWENRASVVPVGVDEQFLKFSLPAPLKIRAGRPVRFVYVGTLSLLRNLHRILHAAKQVARETDEFRIDLVGPDTSGGIYQEAIEQLGIGTVVAIKPGVPYNEIPRLLAGYDVGLAYVPDRPTWHYQPSIKVLEYRAMGMPIVSMKVASHLGIVVDGFNGLLVNDTVSGLASAIRRLIAEDHLLPSLKENALNMREGRTWDNIAAMYEQRVYNRLTNGRQAVASCAFRVKC